MCVRITTTVLYQLTESFCEGVIAGIVPDTYLGLYPTFLGSRMLSGHDGIFLVAILLVWF